MVPAGYACAWAQISAGHNHSCATRESGLLLCWGHQFHGESKPFPEPVIVPL